MSGFLTALGRDWMRAPISGTAAVVCYAGFILDLCYNDNHGMLLWAILGMVIAQGRGPRQMERHPGCVAPHCLRGGICTGPCKVDQP